MTLTRSLTNQAVSFCKRVILRLLAAAVLCAGASATAQTSCTAANRFSFSFANQTAATLNYANSYNYNAANGSGQTRPFTLSFATFNLTSSLVATTQMPAINALINDGNPATGNNLMIGGVFALRTTNITANANVIVTNFTFATPVREFSMQVNDIDFATAQYRDWIHISGSNGGNVYSPSITTTFGNNNGAGPKTATNSTVQLGASTTPLVVGVNEGIGNATSGNNANNGTITLSFAQPVTGISLRYGNANQVTGGGVIGQQAFGVQSFSFCPMPTITVAKSSAPVATTGINRFAIPASDVDYTITVTNSGGSTVDIDSATIADILPANVTFFNGDIDAVTAGTQNVVLVPNSSGVTLAAGNVQYSNNGGSTYVYTPAAGYDAAVNALRFSVQGTMAANSSFSLRFRTRVK